MRDKLTFSTLDGTDEHAGQPCSLCGGHTVSLEYNVSSDDETFQQLQGRCCLTCAGSLLSALERMEKARAQETQLVVFDSTAN